MVELYKNLDKIAKERINVEFSKMLCGKTPMFLLSEYNFIFSYIIPEIEPMIGFKQNNPYHWLDVWNHSLHVLFEVKEKDLPLRLAALFHDIGKPSCYVEGEDGVGHFYGHADKSTEITEKVLKRLKYSNDIIEEVLTLVKYHDMQISLSNKFIRKMLNKMPKETFEKLLVLKKADILGQANVDREKRLGEVDKLGQMLAEFKMEEECFSLKHLKINGNDLIKMGFKPGKEMGVILNRLFEMVVEEQIENDYEVLKSYVERMCLN
jgi:tRNA nucleotidyltransferase (CCA-adding enzyme)